MKIRSILILLIFSAGFQLKSDEIVLPTIGDTLSGIVSTQQEYRMGQSWLKAFRSQVREFNDPLIKSYLENLLYNLATYSELDNPKLEIILIPNNTINAFAVPGGIIGVHTGLFGYAETEDQFASVMAHELAHLSQRHFARRIENNKDNSIAGLAGLLAGLVLASTLGGDAAMAAMTAGQAFAAENRLRYSRANEKEADRIGLKTMKKANRDPRASTQMFEIMLKKLRQYGDRPPEFLLTHPVTEKRLADAKSRTINEPRKFYESSLTYHFIRARVKALTSNNLKDLKVEFTNDITKGYNTELAAQYGLALILSKKNEHEEARRVMNELLTSQPDQILLTYSDIELDINATLMSRAFKKIDNALSRNPDNTALLSLRADAFWKNKEFQKSAGDYRKLVSQNPSVPHYWYQLAEVEGLAGNIRDVHTARAEYFILIGSYEKAEEHLAIARRLSSGDFKKNATIAQRINELKSMQADAEKI